MELKQAKVRRIKMGNVTDAISVETPNMEVSIMTAGADVQANGIVVGVLMPGVLMPVCIYKLVETE